jgi:hypothetical protein
VFVQILDSLVAAACNFEPRFIPGEIACQTSQQCPPSFDCQQGRCYPLGTMLDSARFSSLIAEELKLAPTQVKALILGEHGDSMVPIWSSAAVNGLPLTGLPDCNSGFQSDVFERTKGSGAEVITRKGGAGWAVAIAIRDVVHAVLLDRKALLPVSSLVQGAYAIRDICLSVPSVVGRGGVEQHVEIKLWPKEVAGVQQSARALRRRCRSQSVAGHRLGFMKSMRSCRAETSTSRSRAARLFLLGVHYPTRDVPPTLSRRLRIEERLRARSRQAVSRSPDQRRGPLLIQVDTAALRVARFQAACPAPASGPTR